MFDIIEYAEKNNCSIEITPVFETVENSHIKYIKSWYVKVTVYPDSVKRYLEQVTEKALDSMLAEIEKKKAEHDKAKTISAQMAEREKFFKML